VAVAVACAVTAVAVTGLCPVDNSGNTHSSPSPRSCSQPISLAWIIETQAESLSAPPSQHVHHETWPLDPPARVPEHRVRSHLPSVSPCATWTSRAIPCFARNPVCPRRADASPLVPVSTPPSLAATAVSETPRSLMREMDQEERSSRVVSTSFPD
jgi:hypothetical protein